MNSLEVKLKDNPQLNEKKKEKVREILFSCIVPYLNNMIELGIDKRLILKLLDDINDRYKYLNDESIKNLESFICSSQEELDKMRKEYKENPNLEEELESQINNNNDDYNSNDSDNNEKSDDDNNENNNNSNENEKNEIKEE